MALNPLEITAGIGIIVFFTISFILGLKIILRYFKYKNYTLIYVGITWIVIVIPYLPSSINFLLVTFGADMLPNQVNFFIGIAFIPFGLVCWMAAFTELIYKKKQKIILIIFSIYGLIFEIVFIYYLLTNPSLIGKINSPVDMEYKSFVIIYVLFNLILLLITGIKFGLESMRTDNPEGKLKGKLHILAWILYVIGCIFDSYLTLNILTILIVRVILILSSVSFYGSFILPKWMKILFLKEMNK